MWMVGFSIFKTKYLKCFINSTPLICGGFKLESVPKWHILGGLEMYSTTIWAVKNMVSIGMNHLRKLALLLAIKFSRALLFS